LRAICGAAAKEVLTRKAGSGNLVDVFGGANSRPNGRSIWRTREIRRFINSLAWGLGQGIAVKNPLWVIGNI
jgi:hypothetical protein